MHFLRSTNECNRSGYDTQELSQISEGPGMVNFKIYNTRGRGRWAAYHLGKLNKVWWIAGSRGQVNWFCGFKVASKELVSIIHSSQRL